MHHTNPIPPLPNVTPGVQKDAKKGIHFQNARFLAQIVASRWATIRAKIRGQNSVRVCAESIAT
jgi:hypothetical protein